MEKIITALDKYMKPDTKIVSTAIIKGEETIVYSSDNWDISNDIEKINISFVEFKELESRSIKISGEEYLLLNTTQERLMGTNLKTRYNIVGFKDDERKMICKIENEVFAGLGLMQASRILHELSSKKAYLDPGASLGKTEELKWSTPKVLLDNTQNLQRLGLLKVGLSPEEAKVYLTLLQRGEEGEKVGNLNKRLDIKRTTIYRIIDRLISKKWVDKVMERPTGTTFYVARPQKEIIDDIIKDKEDELKILKSFKFITGESPENGWLDVSKEYDTLGIIGVEKDCGLIIFEYDRLIKEDVILQAALQLSYEKLKENLQPDPEIEEFTIDDLEEIKMVHTKVHDYFGVVMYLKFKEGSEIANNVGTDWIVAARHVAIPIDEKIYVIWGSEEKFPILLSIILRIN